MGVQSIAGFILKTILTHFPHAKSKCMYFSYLLNLNWVIPKVGGDIDLYRKKKSSTFLVTTLVKLVVARDLKIMEWASWSLIV